MNSSVIGKTIGRYKIVEHLGRGGMAEVYKAYQPSLDRYVAIKLMHTFLAEDPDFFSRFTREAKNVGALRHPNIVQIHDFDHDGPTYYMVMEFIDGGPLKNRLEEYAAQGQHIPLAEAIRIIQDVGSALSYAHKRDMIHRDIKPANVMLDSSGRVILTDFGIAKLVSGTKYTASGAMMGTPSYMAPEQGLGQPGDARADIYSLGVMFYQLATGRLPFEADTPIGVILKHVNEPLPLPRTLNPDLPQSVENIILKAMAKDPAERYQSMDEMLAHLDDLPSAEHIELPMSKTLINDKGEVTMRGMPDARTGATVVGARTQTAQAPAPARAGIKPLALIVGGLIALLLVGGVAAAAIFGARLFASAQPTDLPTAADTAAPT
ncbi:MAG: protein kinase, partial [Chloroflexota bacterium]